MQQFVAFYRLYCLRVALDASKMKLVTLSGRSSTVSLGEWKFDQENTAVCICVFCVISSNTHTSTHTQHGKNRCSSVFYS